jgi:hypothetical protein
MRGTTTPSVARALNQARHRRLVPPAADDNYANPLPARIPGNYCRKAQSHASFDGCGLKHDPEKCEAVFRKDHAQTTT